METNLITSLNNITPTELLKLINESQKQHEELKKEIIDHTFEIQNIETLIKSKVELLTNIEEKYITLIEELNNRQP